MTPKGPGGIRSYAMAKRLIERGHNVIMVCGSFEGGNTGLDIPFSSGIRRGFVEGIEVIEFNLSYSNTDGFISRSWSFLIFAIRSSYIALTENYDLVFATSTPLTAGIPGILVRWLRCKPFVFEVRDLWPELPRAMGVIKNPVLLWAMSLLELFSYRSANCLVGLSPGIVEGIMHRGVQPERIALVPNGCDLDLFTLSLHPWRPNGVNQTDLMAVFAGTHGQANGLDSVLDAAAELKRRGRFDIKLVLIGSGKLKPALKERALLEELDNVVFLDPVNKTRLASLLASTDLGLQVLANVPAFYYGTSPNKFFDYIAAGLPVLNNYPGWLADMIIENKCGFTVSPNDPAAFADALEFAADDRNALKKMGNLARELAQVQFDRHLLADQWVDWVTGAKI